MQRIDIAWMLEAFKAIDTLADYQEGQSGGGAWAPLYDARRWATAIAADSVYSKHLKVSQRKFSELLETIEPLQDKIVRDQDYVVSQMDGWEIRQAAVNLKLVFLSELSTLPAYLLTPKASYDLDLLIDGGFLLFPSSLSKKAPEAVGDAYEAGSCLALERWTACGFHTYRVVEAVLRRYWDAVTSGQDRPKIESLGKMAAELNDKGFGEKKVTESLLQLARLHRNPLAHPDVHLTLDEAIAALGMARSVLTHMLAVMPDASKTA